MKILVVGNEINLAETQKKFGSDHNYLHLPSHSNFQSNFDQCDVVFDFIPEEIKVADFTFKNSSKPYFMNACNVSLSEMLKGNHTEAKGPFFGFNGMPTLLDRPILEVSLLQKSDEERLSNVCKDLGTTFLAVDDRVGMVTPRVISMIINEAYFTVQEGTASREDIDVAMKLGTNYPFGPFEWCERIGIKHVYELLSAIYADTRDERYKICPLLKKEYLRK
jgi:3-hydroxybutyryl-CoA dehydrogenase